MGWPGSILNKSDTLTWISRVLNGLLKPEKCLVLGPEFHDLLEVVGSALHVENIVLSCSSVPWYR